MTGDELALYVHWPFCVSKCPYCDFNSHVRETIDQDAWRNALLADLAHEARLLPGRRLSSIFFGGGTPSLMEPSTAGAIIEAAREPAHIVAQTMDLYTCAVELPFDCGRRDARQGVGDARRGLGQHRLQRLTNLQSKGGQARRAVTQTRLGHDTQVAAQHHRAADISQRQIQ